MVCNLRISVQTKVPEKIQTWDQAEKRNNAMSWETWQVVVKVRHNHESQRLSAFVTFKQVHTTVNSKI